MKDQTMTMEEAARAYPGIGRRKMIQLTGRTGWACSQFLKGCPDKPRPGRPADAALPTAEPRGVMLRDVRVVDSKPNEGIKHLLFGLRKGMGFPVQELADQWGLSEETLKRHATKYGALKYVETGTAVWTHCVLHPDTALEYGANKRRTK